MFRQPRMPSEELLCDCKNVAACGADCSCIESTANLMAAGPNDARRNGDFLRLACHVCFAWGSGGQLGLPSAPQMLPWHGSLSCCCLPAKLTTSLEAKEQKGKRETEEGTTQQQSLYHA